MEVQFLHNSKQQVLDIGTSKKNVCSAEISCQYKLCGDSTVHFDSFAKWQR